MLKRHAIWAAITFGMTVLTLSAFGQSSSSDTEESLPATSVNDHARYSWIRDNIFNIRCMDCHSAQQGDGDGLDHADFDTYEGTLKVVIPGDPEKSKLYIAVKTKKMPKGMDPMPGMPNPPQPVPLSSSELQAISDWIASGAPNN